MLILAAAAAAEAAPPLPSLPTLLWEERSDWLNVRAFGAFGDGAHDDAAAINSALHALSTTNNHTLFFPAGTYKISTTLLLNRTIGALLIGCGAATTLLWAGPAGGIPPETTSRMLWSDGNTRFEISGFVFDGANVANVGLDHDSKNQYESRVVHQNLAFYRFTTAGVRTGHNQFVASAEMTFVNCLFAYNTAGAAFDEWNGEWRVFAEEVRAGRRAVPFREQSDTSPAHTRALRRHPLFSMCPIAAELLSRARRRLRQLVQPVSL